MRDRALVINLDNKTIEKCVCCECEWVLLIRNHDPTRAHTSTCHASHDTSRHV